MTFSDEIVTAAQHLYEMVSFYFDDLGKLLFVDVLFWFSLYRVCFGFVCLTKPRTISISFIPGHPATQQEFILVSRRIRCVLAVLFERRQSFDVDYHLHCDSEARLHGARDV